MESQPQNPEFRFSSKIFLKKRAEDEIFSALFSGLQFLLLGCTLPSQLLTSRQKH